MPCGEKGELKHWDCCFKRSCENGDKYLCIFIAERKLHAYILLCIYILWLNGTKVLSLFSSGYRLNFERIKSSEFEETAPLKDNLVSVFYTESVFIAESGGNIHCASSFESFKNWTTLLCTWMFLRCFPSIRLEKVWSGTAQAYPDVMVCSCA